MEYLAVRNQEESIFDILKIIFQERRPSLDAFDNTSLSLDEILLWLEENIPEEYQVSTAAASGGPSSIQSPVSGVTACLLHNDPASCCMRQG